MARVAQANVELRRRVGRLWVGRAWLTTALLMPLLALLMVSSAAAHEYHSSAAEVELNSDTGRLEVALKLIPEDLEAALAEEQGSAVHLDGTEGIDDLIQDYLATRFRVTGPSGELQPILWVGKEVDYRAVWLYFEVPVESSESTTLDNRVLLDREPKQINTVVYTVGATKTSWTFAAGSKPVVLPASRTASVD